MIVISDTSPLSNLFIIGHLDLLKNLYGQIIVPEAVMTELLELSKRGIDISAITNASWIEVRKVPQFPQVRALLNDLDIGESEAIILAESLHADWLLIDETKGRNIAKHRGLHIIGLLGVLLLAKQKGLIPTVKEVLDDLKSKAKFRIKDELYDMIISSANE